MVGRKGERDDPARFRGGNRQQPVVVRVAADDAVEQDDVRGAGDVGLAHDIRDAAIDTLAQPVLLEQLPGLAIVCRRELEVRRAIGAALEQLDLERSRTASDLEDRCSGNPAPGHELDQPPARASETLPPVAVGVSAREPLVEELAVRTW
jgi:hypothetical protein